MRCFKIRGKGSHPPEKSAKVSWYDHPISRVEECRTCKMLKKNRCQRFFGDRMDISWGYTTIKWEYGNIRNMEVVIEPSNTRKH